jgi:para-nitrobenzyl esterase
MSGVMSTPSSEDIDHRPIIDAMLEELHIPADKVEELETVPYDILDRVYNRVVDKLGTSISWTPVANGWYLGDPMKVGFSDYAKKVPVMSGTVVAEFASRNELVAEHSMTEEEKYAALKEKFGEDTDAVIAAFRKPYPNEDLNLVSKIDTIFRPATVDFIKEKAAVSEVPAYLYLFALKFDIKGGAYAWHCSDIPFVFHNTARVPSSNMEGVTDKLEAEMSGAWVNFAYTGNPNHTGMVKWEPYTDENPITMVFDRTSHGEPSFDTELLSELSKHSDMTGAKLLASMMKKKPGKDTEKEWIY